MSIQDNRQEYLVLNFSTFALSMAVRRGLSMSNLIGININTVGIKIGQCAFGRVLRNPK
jgi:hypothetical protein